MKNFGNGLKLFQLIPVKQFQELCDKFQIDKQVRVLTAQKHVWLLVLAYLYRLESLREIESIFGISKSTLSDANANRESKFFEELCRLILWKILDKVQSRKVRRSIRTILAMDSTECTVHGSLAALPKWKKKRSKGNQAGAKLHVIWNINGEWIEEFKITAARVHDCPVAKTLKIRANCTYVFDRAYNELGFWWKIVKEGSHFVSRLKKHSYSKWRHKIILKNNADKDGVLSEQDWKPSYPVLRLAPEVPKDFKLRHIIYRDPETKKVFDFITSDFESPAQEIADIYKKRWAVELLFRWLKSHLKIRRLECRNTNAVEIQLAVAVLVQLLVQFYRLTHKCSGSLWQCLRSIRTALTQLGTKSLKCELFDPFPSNPLSRAEISL